MTWARSPEDPHWEARTRASFRLQGVMAFIRAETTDLEPGRRTIELPYRPQLAQHDGYFHAGITSTNADSAGGYAAYTLFAADSKCADRDRLNATGRVERSGRTLTVTRVDVDVVGGGRRTPCALLQQTLIRVGAPDGGGS